nr:ABC transporter permease subunit [Pseudomonas sp. R3.Fl]
MLALLVSSFQPFPGVVGAFSTRHYQAVLASPEVRGALFNTLGLACGTGLLTSTLGLLLAQFERGLGPRAGHLLRFLAMLPLAMPGVVVALALSWAYVGVPGLRALYGSFAMMVIALVVALTPLALQIGQASLAQLSPQLYEAARVSGAAPWRAWRDTSLRLCLPGFLVGWYLALIAVCGSLDIPLLLGGPGLETLSTTIFTYNARGQLGQAAALLCLLLLLILLPAPLLAAGRPLRRWRRVRVAEDLS